MTDGKPQHITLRTPSRCGCELSEQCSTHQHATDLQAAAAEVIARAYGRPGALNQPEGLSPELASALHDLRTIYEVSHGRGAVPKVVRVIARTKDGRLDDSGSCNLTVNQPVAVKVAGLLVNVRQRGACEIDITIGK